MPSYDPSLFNVDPYYDDFSEDKKFLRLMFRPGYGVQARELTQIQTLLQNQIERMGSHVFEEGSIVLDGQISENRVKYAKVELGGSTEDPADFIGAVISSSGKARARVVHAEVGLSGSTLEENRPVLFFEYMEGGATFDANDVIAATASNGVGITASITGPSCCFIGDALVASVERGVRFVEGYFVLNDSQSIGAYTLTGSAGSLIRNYNNPTTRIGFSVDKSFVTATDDTSLNDPAFGFYNYAAPGSDRFKIELNVAQNGFTASDTSSVDNFSRVGFIEFMRVVDGDIVKIEKYPDYAVLEDTLARRTYDESGNYTVNPFELTLNGPTSSGGNTVLKAELSSGKAYVFGYEFETQAKTKLNIPCARGGSHERTVTRDFNRSIGPYTKVEFSGITGSFNPIEDPTKHPTINLSRGASGSALDVIGSARMRWVEPYSASVYNLSLYDIKMSGTASFEETVRIHLPSLTAHMFTLTGSAGLENESQDILLYQVPEGSGVTSFSSGDYAIVGYDSRTAPTSAFTYTINSYDPGLQFPINTTVSLPDSDVLVFDGTGKVLAGTAARGANVTELSVTVTNAAAGTKVFTYATQEPGNDSTAMVNYIRDKTEQTVSLTLTGAWGSSLTGDERGSTSDTLFLNGYTDVIELLSITGTKGASSGISLNSYFALDNGQRDSFYDWSRLTLGAGVTGVTGPFYATFKYYSHENVYGAYTVASYPDYENIPTYTSKSTGTQYKLRDCIDFRPDRSLSGDIMATPWIPANSAANDNDFTYTHYLPRTDKIVLTRDRNFAVISGTPSLNADIPADDPNAMTLYTVQVNPYTFNSNDASIRYVENKRYTMRDIGDLEKRIEAVEYYTTLSLLEQEAKAKSIRDENGDEMPKRGILVDQFKGHAVADNADPMFAASVDYENNELRPPFSTRSYGLTGAVVSSVTGNATDGVYTLSFTQSPEISHLLASESIQINPFNVINYMGHLSISPAADTWYDTTKQPRVRVNVEGENDNWEVNSNYGFGTRFNDWESIWFGKENQNSKNNRPNLVRNKLLSAKAEGLSLNSVNSSVAPESMKKIVANKTVARDVLPVARQQEITLMAKGLKPSTTFYVFCDDMNVTPYCTGGSQVTTENGEASIKYLFNYPNASTGVYEQNFLVGRHNIRITDVASADSVASSTMAAEATYAVEGAYDSLSEDGLLATRIAETRRKSVKTEKVVSNLSEMLTSLGEIRGYSEPLSQTFYVDPVKYPQGIFLKSVDLYFESVDTLNTIPVTVQIRPTVSGYPHPSKVLPFATSVKYNDGSISTVDLIEDGDADATNFPFSTPVYLLPAKEYAVCVSTNSSNYALLKGSIGSTIIRASEEDPKIGVIKQPMMRSLFKPQNSGKYAKSENETLALRLKVCKFSSSGTVTVQNSAISSGSANLNINEFRLNAVDSTPEDTGITYAVEVQASPSVNYASLTPNKNTIPASGYHAISSSTGEGNVAEIVATLSASPNGYVSPIFDLQKSSFITVSNTINNQTVTDSSSGSYNGELEPTNEGVASGYRTAARYISKKVTLESGMEAENITVSMSLCNPKKGNTNASSVKVFVRPVPVGEPDFDNVNYVELTSTDTGVSSSDSDFREVTFTNIGYTTLQKFKTFSIKVVMLGDDNGAAVPKIRNLRMIAT
jgi:hypothetical protein